MPKFLITAHERWVQFQSYETVIEAADAEQALQILQAEYDDGSFEDKWERGKKEEYEHGYALMHDMIEIEEQENTQ
jgi:hypothetical protein